MRRQAGARGAAGLRVGPLWLRFQAEPERPLGADGGPDPVGHRAIQAMLHDDVLRAAGQLVAKDEGLCLVELQDARDFGDGRPSPLGGELGGRGDQALARDRRGQHDRPGPVVDVPALARRLDGDRRLRHGLAGQPLALDHLPVGQPRDEHQRAEHEDDQQEEEAAS